MIIISIWHTVVSISGSGGCGFVVFVVGLWGVGKHLIGLKEIDCLEEKIFEQRGQHVQVWDNC